MVPKLRKSLCAVTAFSLLLAGCAPAPEVAPTPEPSAAASAPAPSAPAAQPELSPEEELALDYLVQKYGCRVYTAAAVPETPQEGDLRLDGLAYLGESVVYETVGVAYEMETSLYCATRNEAGEQVFDWWSQDPVCLVLERGGSDGSWQGVFGAVRRDDRELDDVIQEVAWGLMDVEVSLGVDGYPQLIGPGSAPNFHFGHEEPTVTVLPDGEPIYNEGDQWLTYGYEDLTALCYRTAASGEEHIHHIETSRADVSTYRGIRIGSSREEVLAAYPNLFDRSYWDREGDYLWYCRDENGFGAALLFWFEDDTVVKLELINMFD